MTPVASKVLIRGGRVLDLEGDLDKPPRADLLIENGCIVSVGAQTSLRDTDVCIVNADGMLVSPGFVNAHYHSHDVLLRGMFEQLPLEVWGLQSFPSNYTRRSNEEVRLRTLLGAAENLRSGVTTVQDMVTVVGPDREHAQAILSAYEEIGLRVVLGMQFGDRALADTVPFWREDLTAATLAQLPGNTNPRPMQDLVVNLLDQTGNSRLTWALGPSAPQRCSEPLLLWVAALSAERDLQVFTHVYESKSQALLARIAYASDNSSLVTFLGRMNLLNERLTIAHGVWINSREVAQFGAAGSNLACNPMSNLKLLNGIAPIRSYAEAGAGIAIGCDNCSGNDAQNIFESMKAFALWWACQSQAGETGAAQQAFRAATLGGARALGLAGRIGAVRPGYRADLVLLDLADPAFVPLNSAVRQLVYSASPRAIRAVLIDGEIVVCNQAVVRVNEAALAATAHEMQEGIARECQCIGHRCAALAREILRIHEKIRCFPIDVDRFRLDGDRGTRPS
jgi:5-methylthioadenosine/S-adenosylhomocysteine deaminase